MRTQISSASLQCLQEDNENYISRLITHDATWIYHYNLESMAQSEVWENPMASVWWDSQGMTKKDYFGHGKTVSGNTSVQQIKNPRKAIPVKWRKKLTSGVLLMQDNALSQNSDVISRVWL